MTTKTNTVQTQTTQDIAVPGGRDFLDQILLSDIRVSKTNAIFREESEFSQENLKELIASISKQGVLQPILLRENTPGDYILVAGERRFRACKHLGLETIPAYVKEMTEEEAFEMQLTENLQRKDVHPMKEAKAYKQLLGYHKFTTQELALRFGKSETYVLQRLRLMSLLPEISKDFEANDLTLAQALVIARLEKADQEELLENCKNHDGNLANKRNYYQSAQELENYIAEQITRELKGAPWDLNDTQLVPKAGACSACPKRSGAQSVLFADIKEKDRCFDSACFKGKHAASMLITVKKLVEEKPDTIFLTAGDYYGVEKPAKEIIDFLTAEKIKPLDNNRGFSTNNYGSHRKAIKGYYINGDKAGHFSTVYVAGPETKAVAASSASGEQKVTAEDIKESIARIKERTKRSAELDGEKVYIRVIEAAYKHDALKRGKVKHTPADIALMVGLLHESTNYSEDLKAFGLKDLGWGEELKEVRKQADAMGKLTLSDVAEMARHVALHNRDGFHLPQKWQETIGQLIIRAARSWGIPVDQFEKDQAAERVKREARAAERIKVLEAQLKPAGKKKGGKK